MKRRTFLIKLSTVVAAPLVLKACGGGDDGVTTSGGTTTTSGDGDAENGFRVPNADAATTHPHSFVVICADEGMAEVTYTAGGSGHTHTVTISGDQLDTIFNGGTVHIDTTNGGHPHSWDISMPTADACTTPAEPPPNGDVTTGGW